MRLVPLIAAAVGFAVSATAEEPAPAEPAATSATTGKRLVAILDLKGGKDAESTAEALTTVLTAEVGATAGYAAVSRNELKGILAHKADASMLGCDSVGCLADVGKLVDASLVISGSVSKVEGAHVLALTLVDPAGPTIVDRQEVAWRGKPEEMLGLIRPTVDRLLSGPDGAKHTGTIEVFATDGATVVLDGKEIGTAPLKEPIRNVATGVHNLAVSKDGSDPWQSDIIVSWTETTISRVELVDQPFTQKPWFWLAGGGTVLLAGGAAAGIATWAILNQDTPAHLTLAPKP